MPKHRIARILYLYPPTWRRRYATRMTALLDTQKLHFLTIIGLFFGALDAWRDGRYPLLNPFLPWRQLQTLRRLTATALVAFWLALIPMIALPNGFSDPTRFTFFAYEILPISLPLLFTMLVAWVGWQTSQHVYNLLLLLPIFLFSLLTITGFSFLLNPNYSDFTPSSAIFSAGFLVTLLLVAEQVGALFMGGKKSWRERQKRPHLLVVLLNRLFLLGTLSVMLLFWIISLVQFINNWQALPEVEYLSIRVAALSGLSVMFLALLLSLFAWGRGFGALRAIYAAFPPEKALTASASEQSQLEPEIEPDQPNYASLRRRRKGNDPFIWLPILPVLALVLVETFLAFFRADASTPGYSNAYYFEGYSTNITSSYHIIQTLNPIFIAFLAATIACVLIAFAVLQSKSSRGIFIFPTLLRLKIKRHISIIIKGSELVSENPEDDLAIEITSLPTDEYQ